MKGEYCKGCGMLVLFDEFVRNCQCDERMQNGGRVSKA